MLTLEEMRHILIIEMQLWRNWHTRMIQVHVLARECGFKSHQLHEIWVFLKETLHRQMRCFFYCIGIAKNPLCNKKSPKMKGRLNNEVSRNPNCRNEYGAKQTVLPRGARDESPRRLWSQCSVRRWPVFTDKRFLREFHR